MPTGPKGQKRLADVIGTPSRDEDLRKLRNQPSPRLDYGDDSPVFLGNQPGLIEALDKLAPGAAPFLRRCGAVTIHRGL